MRKYLPSLLVAAFFSAHAFAQVVINEIHYHPVENPHFDASGNPTYSDTNAPANLADDVHEFVEIYNAGATPVDLSGWKLSSGIDFTFPGGSTIAAGGYRVVAKNVGRIQTVYGLVGVLGPFASSGTPLQQSKLSNGGATLKLENAGGAVVDSVSYGTNFPWAISANALGVGDDFSGLNSANYQYKGRSLQRVSATAASNDPANWVAVRPALGATTFADLPTPGAANIVARPVPKPVVTASSVVQNTDGAAIIRANVVVKVTCSFSSTASLSNVQLEYFVDDLSLINSTQVTPEPRTLVAMTLQGSGQYTATIPGKPDRSIVRYRIKADRGDGLELVAPRADDPAVVFVGAPTYPTSPAPPNAANKVPAAREAWYPYFVTPLRSSVKPIIDVIIPTDGTVVDDTATTNVAPFKEVPGANPAVNPSKLNGFQAMAFDCNGSPKRATAQDTSSSYPRETPYVLSGDRIWNDVVPGVFVSNGVIHDIQIRFHGSRWNRRPSRKSFKIFFADYDPYLDGAGNYVTSIFETDKTDFFLTAHGLNQLAGLPLSTVRWVDWYFNSDAVIPRVEQGEYDGELLSAYHDKIQRLNPGSVKEDAGEYYKSVGYIVTTAAGNTSGEGPYGNGNEWPLPAAGFWTELQRFDYTFALQNHTWKGAAPIRDMVNGMWAARGDVTVPLSNVTPPTNPNLVNTKVWMDANWDKDTELTSLALNNWMCPWDDTTQNHFLWRRANGKWVRLLWDFDGEYGTSGPAATSSIYVGEVNDSANNFRGPNYVKDTFTKTYRTEYKQRMWFLNNTLLEPENLQSISYATSTGGTNTYYAFINAQAVTAPGVGFALNRYNSVNTQVALGTFYKPRRPTNTAPAGAAAVLPGASLTGSAYLYDAAFTHAAAPTTSPHTSTKWEIRAATDNYDNPIYIATSTVNKTSLPIPFGQLTYGKTYFWRITYYDADGHPSITSAETSFSYGPTSVTAGNISINEVMAENLGAILNGADQPDYVELKNNTAAAISIAGWNLTDDELLPTRYTFPVGTSIAAGGYLVVWCDASNAAPGLHTGFTLSRKGQRVILSQSGTVRDAIAFGPQMPNAAIGRFADGTGAWTLVNASPGATNTARAFSTVTSTLKINEWMAVPASGQDWFEIYYSGAQPVTLAGLWLSDTPGTPKITQIPALSFVAAGGCVRFDADGTTDGFNSVNFKLATGGDNLVLSTSDGLTTIDSRSFATQQPGVSQGRFPDGTANIVSFPISSSPSDNNWLPASVRINEALSNSSVGLQDYVEIFNPTASDVDISGWWLSDDHFLRQKYQFPAASIVPAGGYFVVLESQFNIGVNAFSLNSLGDEIVLTATAAGAETGARSQFNFGEAGDDVAFGYVPTAGAPEFWPQVSRTMGSTNSAPVIGPVIINEIHYHPPDLGAADNGRDEFVELHNITTTAVSISGWRVKGGSDFIFAAGTILLPGDYILVVGFNPATDAASLAAFRAALSVPASVPIYGPFLPKLANDSATVELGYPGTPVGSVTPYIDMDKVEYADFAPWAVSADGAGPSLQRISRAIIGNDAANWTGATPTPGAVNTGQSAILDNDGDGLPNAWEDANGFDKFSAADAALDADGDGRSNLAEYIAGTDPRNAASFLSANVTRIAGGFRIQFTAQAGKGYTIQYRDSLATGAWLRLTDIAPPGGTQVVTFDDLTAQPQRFYRVVTPTVP